MKKIAFLSFSLFFQTFVYGLEIKPWLGNIFEFEVASSYCYSRFTKVSHAVKPLKNPSNDQLLAFSLEMTPLENWQGEVEVEFAHTPRQRWGYRSAAGQIRKLWMNDIVDDPISLATGIILRGVSHHSLKDISSPYHAHFDAELNASIGKEWHENTLWQYRIFAFEGIGRGNKGSFWSRTVLAFLRNWNNRHHASLFLTGYFGMGSKRRVNINHFHGWKNIHHQSLEVGIGYRYYFDYYGALCFDASYRYYARSFPERAFFLIASYRLPFSFF